MNFQIENKSTKNLTFCCQKEKQVVDIPVIKHYNGW